MPTASIINPFKLAAAAVELISTEPAYAPANANPTDFTVTIPADTTKIIVGVGDDAAEGAATVTLAPATANQGFTQSVTNTDEAITSASIFFLDSPAVVGAQTLRIAFSGVARPNILIWYCKNLASGAADSTVQFDNASDQNISLPITPPANGMAFAYGAGDGNQLATVVNAVEDEDTFAGLFSQYAAHAAATGAEINIQINCAATHARLAGVAAAWGPA